MKNTYKKFNFLLVVFGLGMFTHNIKAYTQHIYNDTGEKIEVKINYVACPSQKGTINNGETKSFKHSGLRAGCCISGKILVGQPGEKLYHATWTQYATSQQIKLEKLKLKEASKLIEDVKQLSTQCGSNSISISKTWDGMYLAIP